MTLSKLIESEVADFFAGFGGPCEPDIQSGEAQQQLTGRLLSLLERRERDKQEPVAYMYRDKLHADARFSLESRFGNWSPEDIAEYEITETKLYAAPPAPVVCPKCGGTGMADSGGVHPWGEPIEIPCDCRSAPVAQTVQVPDEWTWDEAKRFVRDKDISFPVEATHSAVEAYRAAMLKGGQS